MYRLRQRRVSRVVLPWLVRLADVGPGFGTVSGAADGDGVDGLMLLWLSNRVLVGCEGGEPLVVLGGELMVVVDASLEL